MSDKVKVVIIFLLILFFAFLVFLFWGRSEQKEISESEDVNTENLETAPSEITEDTTQSLGFISATSDKGVDINIFSPINFEAATCPFVLAGEAPGSWFFEGDFPVTLESTSGEELLVTYASTYSDWMTEQYVDFVAEIECPSCPEEVVLVLQKDNPSGLTGNDDLIRINITFANSCVL